MFLKRTFLFIFSCWCAFVLSAQIEIPISATPAPPASWSVAFTGKTVDLPAAPAPTIRPDQVQNPLFSVPTPVDFDLIADVSPLVLPDGTRIWQWEFRQLETKGIALLFDDYYLPSGSMLSIYAKDPLGPTHHYTSATNNFRAKMISHFVIGKSIVVRYAAPKYVQEPARLHCSRIERQLESAEKSGAQNFGFGSSNDCQVNIDCPEASGAAPVRSGVVRIMMVLAEGTGWCSGSLINNTSQDGTPYLLSAFHCQDGFTPEFDFWRFDFLYEGSDCADPMTEPQIRSRYGCEWRAGYEASDFMLLELDEAPSLYWNAIFNGWDRSNSAPANATLVHHPRGDIKKFSADEQAPVVHPASINWSNGVTTPPNFHLRSVLDTGTFEIGSSGAPLFDEQQRIVGQLHGGLEDCEAATIYAGRFYQSWNGGGSPATRLKDWLDPTNTGQTQVIGYYPTPAPTATLSGQVVTPDGDPLANAKVIATGDETLQVLTDVNGTFTLTLDTEKAYTISYQLDTLPDNGVKTSDMLSIRKHILTLDTIDTPYRRLAANVNNSESGITTADIIEIRKVILYLNPAFPVLPSWRFIPVSYAFVDSEEPWNEAFPNAYSVPNLLEDSGGLSVFAVKTGDVNEDAHTGQ